MNQIIRELVRLAEAAESDKSNWDTHWETLALYIRPEIKDIFGSENGARKHFVYDSSAEHYNQLLAAALHSMLTNPSVNWFELSPKNPDLKKAEEIKAYLQKLTKYIHQALANSNFHSEGHELYLDLGCLGTGIFLAMPDDEDIFRFKSRPVYHFGIRVNSKGKVDSIFFKEDMTSRQIFQEYGEDKIPADKIEEMKRDSSKKYTVRQVIIPIKDYVSIGGKKKIWKFASLHFIDSLDIMLREGGFNSFPYMSPRWMVIAGEVYGRSPGMKSLPDIRMLNAVMRDTIRSAQKLTDPPLLVPDDAFLGPVNTFPGGLTSYRSGTQDFVRPLQTGGNPSIGLEIIQEIRTRIKEDFFIDQLQLRDGPQMTATEVTARTDEHLQLLGPILGRLHSEWLQPLITRLLDILIESNKLPVGIPPELADAELEVYFTSQIAKAQRISEAQNLDRVLAQVAPMVQLDPSIMDNFDLDAWAKYSAEIHGIPYDVIRKTASVAELRQARQAQQQQAMQQQQDLNDSQVVKNMGSAVKQG
jgi:hypothetical protein